MLPLLFALTESRKRPSIHEHFVDMADITNGPKPKGFIVNVDRATIYESWSTSSTAVYAANRGKIVELLRQSASWYEVDCDMVKGYVLKNQIQFVDTQTQMGNLMYNARSRLMLRYKQGAIGPGNFDGPGFVAWAYNKAYPNLNIPPTVAGQMNFGTRPTDVKPGDVLGFTLHGQYIDTTAIVTESGTVIHCSEEEGCVNEIVFAGKWKERLAGIRRFV